MHTSISASDICRVCGDQWCLRHTNFDVVAVFGSALWKAKPNDIDVLYNTDEAHARRLARTWADAHGFAGVPLELHKGNSGTIWSPPGAPAYVLLYGHTYGLGPIRPWNEWKGEPLLSSLLRRYPHYGWSDQPVAVIQDTPEDRLQMAVGIQVARIDPAPWQDFLAGGTPPHTLPLRGGWIIATKDVHM